MEKRMRIQSNALKIKSFFVYKFAVLSSVLFLFLIMLAGCGQEKLELNSDWRNRQIIVDGKSDDWVGAMYYFEDENISLGLLNDENFLYACLIAEDQSIRTQVMRQGLTLWFDPNGGKKKTFGIKFPLGMQARGRLGRPGFPTRMESDERGQEQFQERFEEAMTELEILGPGKDESKRMSVEEAKGINIIVRPLSGMLVYELKVPLRQSEEHPYAVGAKPGDTIGIGFLSPKQQAGRQGGRMGGGWPGGGRGGFGGMPGGRGMPGGGRMYGMPRTIKVWAVVQLAAGNSSVPD
jgi:hypothetical protein